MREKRRKEREKSKREREKERNRERRGGTGTVKQYTHSHTDKAHFSTKIIHFCCHGLQILCGRDRVASMLQVLSSHCLRMPPYSSPSSASLNVCLSVYRPFSLSQPSPYIYNNHSLSTLIAIDSLITSSLQSIFLTSSPLRCEASTSCSWFSNLKRNVQYIYIIEKRT